MSSHTYRNFESLHYMRDTTVTHIFPGEGPKAPGLPMAATATIGFSPQAALFGFPGLLGGNTTNVHYGALIAPSFGHGCSSCGAPCGGQGQVQNQSSAAVAPQNSLPPPPAPSQPAYPDVKAIDYYPQIPPGRDAISLGCVKRVD